MTIALFLALGQMLFVQAGGMHCIGHNTVDEKSSTQFHLHVREYSHFIPSLLICLSTTTDHFSTLSYNTGHGTRGIKCMVYVYACVQSLSRSKTFHIWVNSAYAEVFLNIFSSHGQMNDFDICPCGLHPTVGLIPSPST